MAACSSLKQMFVVTAFNNSYWLTIQGCNITDENAKMWIAPCNCWAYTRRLDVEGVVIPLLYYFAKDSSPVRLGSEILYGFYVSAKHISVQIFGEVEKQSNFSASVLECTYMHFPIRYLMWENYSRLENPHSICWRQFILKSTLIKSQVFP